MNSARKGVSNARENVAQFSRHAAELSPEGGLYLRDVADHLARVYGGLDAARELLGGLLEVYLGVENQRLNEVIRTLTTVSTIFLPLTFLAGVWGMNFEFEPEFEWRYGYPFAWICFSLVSGLLLWYFKRKKWW
jgi:magnesium transporter